MDDFISIKGPVECVDGDLVLRIPLDEGGYELVPVAGRIGEVKDGCLCVVIRPWLAEKLGIREGSLVFVDNKNGKFTITRSAENDRFLH